MAIEFMTGKDEWFAVFEEWDSCRDSKAKSFEEALGIAQEAVTLVMDDYGDIGSLALPVTLDEIYTFWQHTKQMWDFSNAIHYEAADLVDVPFTLIAGMTLEEAYALNPEDVTITRPGVLGVPTKVSLFDVMTPAFTDPALAADFKARVDALNADVPSQDAADAIEDAKYWDIEFGKAAEIRAITEEVFPPEVKEAWPNMTPAERERIATEFVQRISMVMGNGEILTERIVWGPGCKSDSGNQQIHISQHFVDYSGGVGSHVDKLIDVLIHETRHNYQQTTGQQEAPGDVVSGWNEKYIEKDKPHPADPGRRATFSEYAYQPMEYDARAFASACA